MKTYTFSRTNNAIKYTEITLTSVLETASGVISRLSETRSFANVYVCKGAADTVYCPECGTPNKDGSKYCVRCGTPLLEYRLEGDSDTSDPQFGGDVQGRNDSAYSVASTVYRFTSQAENAVKGIAESVSGKTNADGGIDVRGRRRIYLAIDIGLILLTLLPWIHTYYYLGSTALSLPQLALKASELAGNFSSAGVAGLSGITNVIAGAGVLAGVMWLVAVCMLVSNARSDFGGNTRRHGGYPAVTILAAVVISMVFLVNSYVSGQFGSYSSYAYSAMSEVLKVTAWPWVTLLAGVAALYLDRKGKLAEPAGSTMPEQDRGGL